jgi:hypothetical protein
MQYHTQEDDIVHSNQFNSIKCHKSFTNKSYTHFHNPSNVCLQPPAHAGSSFADFSALKMEAIRSSKTSGHTRRHIPEDGILDL